MSINILNMCLLIAWVSITVGGIIINVGAGMIVSGVVLSAMVLHISHRFGVYIPKKGEDN